MTEPMTSIQASPATLAKATGIAAAVGVVVLVLFVLPAENGIDITGLGRVMGLTRMAGGEEAVEAEEADAPVTEASGAAPTAVEIPIPTKATIAAPTPMRSDEVTVNLPGHSEIEVKAHMQKGDSFVFNWVATGGPVKVDMHGEPLNGRPDEFTSYWQEKADTSGQGVFVAPFTGTQGWYWRNKGDVPVVLKLKVTGFYKDIVKKGASGGAG